MRLALIIIATNLLYINTKGQTTTTCEVLMETIKGKFDGACNKNLANGIGKSIGIDSYEGNFKNGLPDGEGIYIWANGDFFKGYFKKGLKNGKGDMHVKVLNKFDSIINGYWKKDKYVSLYEKPYEFINSYTCVTSKTVSNNGGNAKSVTFRIISGVMGFGYQNYLIKEGSFSTVSKFAHENTFNDVVFPFRIEFNLSCTKGNEPFEITIFENGNWVVDIKL